jgi:hypothetical protein
MGLSRPFQPTAEQMKAARSVRVGAVSDGTLPVDTEGDRPAFQGEPSEDVDAIRARFEAEAEARSQARRESPPTLPSTRDGDEPDDEATHVYSGRGVRRRTLLGELEGAPLERPVSNATRTAEAFRKSHPSSPTLVSEGVTPPPSSEPPPSSSAPRSVPLVKVAKLDAATIARVDALAARLGMTREELLIRAAEIGTSDPEALAATFHALGTPANDHETRRETLTPTDPHVPAMDARVERRWHEKIAAAQEAGQHVQHCHGERCVLGACGCRCDGCIRINGLLAEARREVLGRE